MSRREVCIGGIGRAACLPAKDGLYQPSMQDAILDFWFGPVPGETRVAWFAKDDAFDAAIRTRFGAAIETALGGGYGDWLASPRGSLARVLLLDQFTRNAFRDSSRAFAGDPEALDSAQAAIAQGFDMALTGVERWFLYMPFEHAESAEAQERALALFEALARDTGLTGPLDWARKHAAVIARFGRYPHRNALLGRVSTPEELAFLREPGSSF